MRVSVVHETLHSLRLPHKFCHFFQVNSVLEKELSSLRDILDQHNKSNVSKKLEQLNKVS